MDSRIGSFWKVGTLGYYIKVLRESDHSQSFYVVENIVGNRDILPKLQLLQDSYVECSEDDFKKARIKWTLWKLKS